MGSTAYDSLVSSLESNGVIDLPMAMVGDLLDIDRRIKDGDESGWRGDPTMGIFVNTFTNEFEVWGLDNRGVEYKACSHHQLSLEILRKLVDGDPRLHDVGAEVLAHNERVKADQAAAAHDKLGEVGDKLQWAIKQDFKSELGHVRPMSVRRTIGG